MTKKLCAAMLLSCLSFGAAQAEIPKSNGEIILDMISAYERTAGNPPSTDLNDYTSAASLLSLYAGTEGTARYYGMLAAISSSQAKSPHEKASFSIFMDILCVPDDLSAGQKVRVLKNYLERNPEKWSSPHYDLVLRSLTETYPCKK